MKLTRTKITILTILVIVGFVVGRLLVRAAMNLLLGGTLFGGNWL